MPEQYKLLEHENRAGFEESSDILIKKVCDNLRRQV
jgi:hypothetical protein